MGEADRIIVHYTSDFKGIFEKVKKFSDYINYLMNRQLSGMLYVEFVEEGILFIYKNIKLFNILTENVSIKKLLNLKNIIQNYISPKDMIEGILDKSNFPTKGISVNFKILSSNPEKKIVRYKTQIQSFISKDIEISHHSTNNLTIKFNTYNTFHRYLTFLSGLISGGLIDTKIPNENILN